MANKPTYIYYLENNNIIFYIGKTINPISRKNKHKEKYGKSITLNIIEEATDWKYWETYWIYQFRAWGFPIINQNNGGGGPQKYTEEHKKKMRKPRKPGTGKKISSSLLEGNHSQYYTDEIKKRISEGNKIPKPFSEEHIKNMGFAKRKQAKPLLQYTKDGIFIKEWESKGLAADWIINQGLSQAKNIKGQIKDACLGRQKTAFGYKWKYKTNEQ